MGHYTEYTSFTNTRACVHEASCLFNDNDLILKNKIKTFCRMVYLRHVFEYGMRLQSNENEKVCKTEKILKLKGL